MKLLPIVAALQIGCISLVATSTVDIRTGPAYDGLTPPAADCLFSDETIKAIRIEAAIFDDAGQEIRRATVRTCTKSKSAEEAWVYTLDDGGTVLSRENDVTRFDEHGRVVEYAVHTWRDGETSLIRYQSEYDPQGRLVQTRIVDDDGATNTVQYTLDEKGDAVIATGIDPDGAVDRVTRSGYDDQHHILSESSGGKGPGETTSFKYDAQGRLIERNAGQGETRSVLLYAYDEHGRPTSYRQLIGSSPQRVWTGGYSYWPNGLIKEEWSFDDHGLPITFESYAYDEHNHHTQEWIYTPGQNDKLKKFLVPVDGRLEVFGQTNGLPLITYTYDAHGNWVKAVETRLSLADDPASERDVASINYRQIEYRARYYGSALGRFTSPDPVIVTTDRLKNPQQLNLYAYVANNPLRFVDPTGEILQCVGSADQQKQCFADLQQIAGDDANRLSMNAKTGLVSFDTKDLDLSKNEGAALVSDLVGSKNTYDLSIGPTVMTDKGPMKVDYLIENHIRRPTEGRESSGRRQ